MKIKEIIRKTPLFVPIKWIAAFIGHSSFPMPFSATIPAEPFLERAIARIGKNPDPARREEQFYSYFSEIWAEGYEKGLAQQYATYLPYIPKGSEQHPFLDIGCGAGEFVSFLSTHNIHACGIDSNKEEINRSKYKNIDTKHENAMQYLDAEIERFSGISLLEVVEHIPPEELMKLISKIHRSLVTGGIILIETINPKNKLAFNSFYTDPTHTRPITSDYLTFLIQWTGFKDAKIIYTGPLAYSLEERNDKSRAYLVYAIIAKK